jgi:hypothetical protein
MDCVIGLEITISNAQIYKMDPKKCYTIKETILNLSTFNYNHHPSRVKMVAKFIRRGIRVCINFSFVT